MRRARTALILLVILFIWIALAGGISLYIEGLWFESVGYFSVFQTTLFWKFLAFLGGFLLTTAVVGLNFWLASSSGEGRFPVQEEWAEWIRQKDSLMLRILIAVVGVLGGVLTYNLWLPMLQYLYQQPVGDVDPIFGRDLSFYFFTLPLWNFAIQFLLALILLSFVGSAFNYVARGHVHIWNRGSIGLTRQARNHLILLATLFFLLLAVLFWLNRFGILYSTSGVVFGAGYADVYGTLVTYWILIVLAVLTAVSCLIALKSNIKPAIFAILGFVAAFVLVGFYPTLLQTFVVSPNELEMETPYIRNNIDRTLKAYRLDQIETSDFAAAQDLGPEALEQNQGTLRNIRLWDWRPLQDVYNQLQSIRLYYDFVDVDIDRYVIEGNYRQVMLSARELDFSRISSTAQNWINQHFMYTHGYGVCLSPVNEVTSEGLPNLFIKDIPPRSTVDLTITRPAIYYGEKTDYPVFVRTTQPEFDYPIGDQNATTTYEANSGVPIDSFFMKLLFAWDLGIYQILFTDYFTQESKVLLNRNIRERVATIAPFLSYDADPYIVIDDGRLVWIQDAYTTTNRYPYSEPLERGSARAFNYIRNSVKVTIDAYTGEVRFYIADLEDALVQTYAAIFPGLFRPLSEMPDSLKDNLRYPDDFFEIQRRVFRRYHMKDPVVFYNQEDLWEIPNEIYRGTEQIMESYYVIMTLPGASSEEFVLLTPFTPKNKNNMIAWLAARSDGEHYGKLILFQFPKQELTYGPMQIEARIDQNPDISQLITLWSQKGSQVIRGNLLVVPVEESILYIEPLYLQADKSEIPELTRVIVVFSNRVALGETLQEALQLAIGTHLPEDQLTQTSIQETGPQVSGPGLPPAELSALIEQANTLFEQGQQYMRDGNWSGYGESQRELQQVLQRLVNRAGGQR